MIRRNLRNGWLSLLATTAVFAVGAWFVQSTVRLPAEAVLVWAGLESVLLFSLLFWSLPKPVTVFYSIFVGGALMRLVSLMLLALLLNALHIPPAVPLLNLVAAYFVLSLVQIPFLGPNAWIS